MSITRRALLVAGALFTCAAAASANERHFTYTYETAVLQPGQVELEPWTTWRFKRQNYYSRFDQRLEFEAGVVEGLQTALYWNMSATTADTVVVDPNTGASQTVRGSGFEFKSISNEWKLQLADPVADPVGLGLYVEGALGPAEAELEGKVLVDKKLDSVVIAANVVGEYEVEFEDPDETEKEIVLELDVGAAYFVTDRFSVGVEVRNVNEFENAEELESSTLFAGPTLGFSQEGWWAAISFLPQVVALKGASEDSALDLEHQERYTTRLLLGLHLQ
ncbi:MAG: DUF6662 family protein [Polyangiaceae bacterium]